VRSQPRKPTISWAASPAAWPAGQGRGFCHSTPVWKDPPGVLHPALKLSTLERHGAFGAGQEEGHRNDLC